MSGSTQVPVAPAARRAGHAARLLVAILFCVSCGGGEVSEAPRATKEVAPAPPPSKPVPGFDYPGGWRTETSCVDICGVTPDSPVERPQAVVCFDPDDERCAAKTGEDDYDYLMLSQHWLPTMCAGLEAGYDTTVTHRAGASCRPHSPSRLTVHGLWQNYEAGFPQCCGEPRPLDPEKVRGWPSRLRQDLETVWPDPTTPGLEGAICEMLNHEWQKHGTCMAEPTDRGAQQYFAAGLDLARRLEKANSTIDGWAGTTRSKADVLGLYERSAQILCDAAQPESLLEIHTCWSRDGDPVDCPPARAFGQLALCGDRVALPVGGS